MATFYSNLRPGTRRKGAEETGSKAGLYEPFVKEAQTAWHLPGTSPASFSLDLLPLTVDRLSCLLRFPKPSDSQRKESHSEPLGNKVLFTYFSVVRGQITRQRSAVPVHSVAWLVSKGTQWTGGAGSGLSFHSDDLRCLAFAAHPGCTYPVDL